MWHKAKWLKFLLPFGCALCLILGLASPALNQVGGQSDVTAPNPLEILRLNPDVRAVGGGPDRVAFEQSLLQADFNQAIQLFEEFQALEFEQLGFQFFGQVPTAAQISDTLCNLARTTGQRAAIVYVGSLENSLELLAVLPASTCQGRSGRRTKALLAQQDTLKTLRQSIPEANRAALQPVLQALRTEVTNRDSNNYLPPAQQLYRWIVAPIAPDLRANEIDTLVFVMDSGLRSTPLAALHDGQQFLIESFKIALIPSFGLTDTRYSDIRKSKILALGASRFPDQQALPAVPVELASVLRSPWKGRSLLNEAFTLENLKIVENQQRYGIIHMATHAEFVPGQAKDSYIQFWDSKLRFDQLNPLARDLGWNTPQADPIELLVLSACRTAMGDRQAELGFAGLAIASGAKSSLASLWYVSDIGTLALMSEFYQQQSLTPFRAAALRETQLAMLKGKVRVENRQVVLSNQTTVPLPSDLANQATFNLSHPYFWSAFIVVGNWN